MKTSRFLFVAGPIAGTISILSAGPGPQYWNRPAAPKPAPVVVTPAAETPAAPASCTACASGGCCKKT